MRTPLDPETDGDSTSQARPAAGPRELPAVGLPAGLSEPELARFTAATNTLLRTTVVIETFGAARVGEARTRLSVLYTIANALSPVVVGVAFGAGAGAAPVLELSSFALALAAIPLIAKGRRLQASDPPRA